MMKIAVTLLVLLYGVLVSSHENKYVPVFMWSNDREKEFSQVFAGHFTSKFDFQSRFISKVADNVLLFIQDKLSLSDILLHGSVFGEDQEEKDYDNLKMLMSDYVSSFLPNVEHAALAVSQIFESDDSFYVLKINAKNLHETKDLNAMFSTNSKKNLFIIDFSHSELSQKEIVVFNGGDFRKWGALGTKGAVGV
ncbi:hypothetical protein HELRODRAFT_167024 [Helobdella robusta]|uniref:Uncharacterized protein n=1 Tax=Helobdella robusta TaxID=6412 RepID=T1EYW8_HELRO|nr:hypothetical protein HELRODRAFT_167024 [Helobdella robusta]ESO11929.1 hypothetical protein HELRODRAFT_167024 [Helobdella robusta]